jgi:hypothetical protein
MPVIPGFEFVTFKAPVTTKYQMLLAIVVLAITHVRTFINDNQDFQKKV